MTLTPEEIAELQRKADLADELQQRIDAVSGNKDKILDEHVKTKQRLKEMEEAEKERQRKQLEDEGRLKELLEEVRKSNEELQNQLKEKDQAITEVQQRVINERLRTDFMAGVAAEVFNPEHVWGLFSGKASDRDGKTIVVYKGVELSPAELPAKLRADAADAYLCRPVKKGGMGAPVGGSGNPPEGGTNPYITGNVTQRIILESENPEEAAKLRAEAQAYHAAQAAKR
jgi:hypothetical protein